MTLKALGILTAVALALVLIAGLGLVIAGAVFAEAWKEGGAGGEHRPRI